MHLTAKIWIYVLCHLNALLSTLKPVQVLQSSAPFMQNPPSRLSAVVILYVGEKSNNITKFLHVGCQADVVLCQAEWGHVRAHSNVTTRSNLRLGRVYQRQQHLDSHVSFRILVDGPQPFPEQALQLHHPQLWEWPQSRLSARVRPGHVHVEFSWSICLLSGRLDHLSSPWQWGTHDISRVPSIDCLKH